MVDAGDEQRHPPGPEPWWGESWAFDVVSPGEGSVAAFVELQLYPNAGTVWVWAAVLRPGRPVVALRDHDVPLPSGRALEVRTGGLWAELTCEAALEHWTLGMEAFGLAFDDPAEAFGRERGERVALGMDLEWEAGPAVAEALRLEDGRSGTGYRQAGTVHGEILVGRERLAVYGHGERSHSWGPRPWWSHRWCEARGRLDDGADVRLPEVRVELDAAGLPLAGAAGDVVLTPVAHAPILVTGVDGAAARLSRSLCRLETTDGRKGDGWLERNEPPSPAGVSPSGPGGR